MLKFQFVPFIMDSFDRQYVSGIIEVVNIDEVDVLTVVDVEAVEVPFGGIVVFALPEDLPNKPKNPEYMMAIKTIIAANIKRICTLFSIIGMLNQCL